MKNTNITKSDLNKVFWRTNFIQASLNFERFHALGMAFCMKPILQRLYPQNNDERKQAIKRNLEFFNSQPYMDVSIIGVNIALEEEKAKGADISDQAINSIKVGMMGPLAGIGDPLWWGTMRPLIASIFAGLAATGNILGPIFFFITWNVIRLGFCYVTLNFGYKQGVKIVDNITGSTMDKLTTGASVLGLFIMGALINAWISVKLPLVLTTTINPQTQEISKVTLQGLLDQILPGLFPLAATFFCVYLLKKGVKPLTIIFWIFVVSIVGYALGFLG